MLKESLGSYSLISGTLAVGNWDQAILKITPDKLS
jgi:hypothetical protein